MRPFFLIAPALLLGTVLWRFLGRRRPTPEERERARRLYVNSVGRMVNGEITDLEGNVVYYSYTVRGVGYHAAQDLSAIPVQVGEPAQVLGPVTVKYSAADPADSIVVCEEWSGMDR